jgi:hypothetical protein
MRRPHLLNEVEANRALPGVTATKQPYLHIYTHTSNEKHLYITLM